VIDYSPPQLAPAEKMHGEQTLRLVAFGYRVNMRSELGIIRSRGCNRKFRQGRLELESFCDLIIDVLGRQLGDGPLTFRLALYSRDSAGGQFVRGYRRRVGAGPCGHSEQRCGRSKSGRRDRRKYSRIDPSYWEQAAPMRRSSA
jgi:hypothetical protein